MTTAALNLTFGRNRTEFAPGETLAVEYYLDPSCARRDRGARNLGLVVHGGQRGRGYGRPLLRADRTRRPWVSSTFTEPRSFETVLPNSPLSYEGVIVKIHWCVRACAFLARGKQFVEECPFRLGNIPPAHAILP